MSEPKFKIDDTVWFVWTDDDLSPASRAISIKIESIKEYGGVFAYISGEDYILESNCFATREEAIKNHEAILVHNCFKRTNETRNWG